MQLDRWQRQLLSDLSVLDLAGFLKAEPLHSFRQVGRASNGAATAKSLELDV